MRDIKSPAESQDNTAPRVVEAVGRADGVASAAGISRVVQFPMRRRPPPRDAEGGAPPAPDVRRESLYDLPLYTQQKIAEDAEHSEETAPSGDVKPTIRFTVLAAHGARLSKEYRLAADGSVASEAGTKMAFGAYEVIAFDASDPAAALAEIGRVLEVLPPYKAITLGVPLDGSTEGEITVKDRWAKGGTDAIPRALSHFGWPDGRGLLLLDADEHDGLLEVLCALYPPFADVAALIRPSASASVIDPKTGERLKPGEHVYVLLDDPQLAGESLWALLRLAWCKGSGGFLKLNKAGAMMTRGPIDVIVGSPERLSYEGAVVAGRGLTTLPRAAHVVAGGNGILCAKALLEFADRHAPAERFKALVDAAKAEPEFVAERDRVRAAHRDAHVKAAVARGKARAQAEREYDQTIGSSHVKADACGSSHVKADARGSDDHKESEREFVPLPLDHTLYWPDGESFAVADIVADPSAFHGKECCDPIEGTDYQTRNCAIIHAQPPRLVISSLAHGGAFTYTAPLPWFEFSPEAAAIVRGMIEACESTGDWGMFTPPVPIVRYGRLSVMADQAAAVLINADVPFYQRGDKLVRPVAVQVQSFHGGTASAPQLVEVELPYLRDTLCRNSRWIKYDARSKKYKSAFPSPDAAQVLLKRFGEWEFPALAGVITTPTLRPDGTILAAAGYDPATQLLLVDPPPMPAIPEHPTKDDALAALRLLKDVLAEFPFADGVSRAVALSAQISTVCRGAYPIMPVHIVDAPAAGTGKSYLLSIVSWIATGQAMPVLGAGQDEGELGKRLDAAVISGQPLICVDNVVGEIGGEAICRLTEQWRPQVRILGLTKLVNVDARGISFFANGNNIVVIGDFCRRVICSRLDAESERPERRQFKNDPMKMILANRGAYIGACLTICRAYITAGRPQCLPPLASYGEWSNTVRSALVWLGEADVAASQETAHAQDPEADALRNLLHEWKAVFGTGKANGQPLREVLKRCDLNRLSPTTGAKIYMHQGLRGAVLAVMPVRHSLAPDATALGQWLRGRKGRRAGGMWFNKKDETGTTPTHWWVEVT